MLPNDPDTKETWTLDSIQPEGLVQDSSTVIKAPFSVQTQSVPFAGQIPTRDWVPHPDRERRMREEQEILRHKPKNPFTNRALIHSPEEYVPGKVNLAKSISQKNRILQIAREIYRESKPKILQWEEAARMVNKATPQELANPNPELRAALAIYKKGKPMTKEKAVEMAASRIRLEPIE